ncbi:MAG TPA: hypothetical protein VL202_24015 [Pararhizobium sp.]|uniref:hypothetical protein n=1 Tax=Pararhizobium sp. TaxID=1977563 RepID=UPI002CB64B93|nr:hypothetical protein [Pararhizobium sp.]HTO34211.1 hypothetical protein [Pararhizobium sp.]
MEVFIFSPPDEGANSVFHSELKYRTECKILESFHFHGTFKEAGCLPANKRNSPMQPTMTQDNAITARQLRPVVITVVAAKLAVFALLMATINLQAPMPVAIEMAAVR